MITGPLNKSYSKSNHILLKLGTPGTLDILTKDMKYYFLEKQQILEEYFKLRNV
jgi:hypothetical protein